MKAATCKKTGKTQKKYASPAYEILDGLTTIANQCSKDPLKFVQLAFPWGKGTLEKYTGPDKWQTEILEAMRDRLHSGQERDSVYQDATAAGHGCGKAIEIEQVIDTPDGKRRWGDLKIGDRLWSPDGRPTTIVAIPFRGVRPCCRMTFDDGASTIVSQEHLWTVRGRAQRRKDHVGGASMQWLTLETQALAKTKLWRSNGVNKTRQWEIPTHYALEYSEAPLPLPPYFVGTFIGDGGRGHCAVTTIDKEVLERFKQLNLEYTAGTKQGTEAKSIYVKGSSVLLRELGLANCHSYEKFIPDCYKHSSIDQRSELLRGLLDTDGTASRNGSVTYSTTSKRLADDIVWLVRSLGGKAWIQDAIKKPWYRDKNGERVNGRDCFNVRVHMPDGFFLGYIKRKWERIPKSTQARYQKRWIDSIEAVGERECMCVTVDRADGLFLANDFIVTHNSGLVAWLILWALVTYPDTRGVVTANTETQLRTKTFAEVAKWYNLCLFKDWFVCSAMSIYSKAPGHDKTWRIDAIPWSETNPEAFAGLHNAGKRTMVIFDEASAISNVIWEVTEGALTDMDTQKFWLCFGNPTRSTGRFFDCFNRFRHRWVHRHIDTRTAVMADQNQIAKWIEDYGEDSDFVKVRVRGVFPSSSSMQFIARDIVDKAIKAESDPASILDTVCILGVDVARFGDDRSVIFCRIGMDARSFKHREYRGLDGWQLGEKVAEFYNELVGLGARRVVINIDAGGVGASPLDWLKKNGYEVNGINFGESASRKDLYANKRAEMWAKGRDWLKAGGQIEDSDDLVTDLTGVEFGYTPKNLLLLEKKEDMKKRGLSSPDLADALMLCFAVPMNEHLNPIEMANPYHINRRAITRDPYA